MSNLLDTVENPGSTPEGAPGSLHRRAWKLGQRLKAQDSTLSAKQATDMCGGFIGADGNVDKSGRIP